MMTRKTVFPDLVPCTDVVLADPCPEPLDEAFGASCDLWGGRALMSLAFLAGMVSALALV